jgi:hypothetical protein
MILNPRRLIPRAGGIESDRNHRGVNHVSTGGGERQLVITPTLA